MSSRFFASPSGVILTAAGIALAELVVGIATSTTSPANALQEKFPTQAGSLELAQQPSISQAAEDEQMAEDEDINSLPAAVTEAIFNEVSRESEMDASKLRIVKVERESWSDGCLGLGGSDTVCTQSLVPGWRVIVASGEKVWVYRTNVSGSLVKLDEEATRTIASSSTTQITRREEVTTRTSRTTQSTTGTTSGQSTQMTTGSSQTTQGASSESTQMGAGYSQADREASIRAQRQAAVTRRSTQVNFSDISEGYWARSFITELAGRGILTGFPDGKFRPNEPVTRAQFAALLASVFKKTKVRNAINFSDVSSSHWAYNRIREAYEMGFIEANSRNNFNPNQSMTRLEILTMLTKGLNLTASNSTEKVLQFYRDANAIPANARSLVAAATERGIVVNYPNVRTCSPNQVGTRAEVAAFLYQAMVSTGDAVAISSPYVAGTQAQAAPVQVAPAQAAPPQAAPAEIAPAEVAPAEVAPPQAAPPQAAPPQAAPPQAAPASEAGEGDRKKPNCNQGIGNGAEGCDPGNSSPHGGSNDETGRTPGGNRK
jgi:hypothetical protein